MNVCFICKYPPIQGGVSMHCYWAARGLAQRGHRVFVVTNADEVEPAFRISLSEADRAVGGEYAPSFPESSGFVKVYSTQPPDFNQMYSIPLNNPTVTRLSSVATDLVRSEQCSVIFAYYLEPYGMAAQLVSHWTGIPYVFKHAGSDLNRLMRLKELETAYREVFNGANRIISHGQSRKQLLSIGIPEERINSEVAFGVPAERFRPDAPALDLNAMLAELSASAHGAESSQPALAPLDAALPILGVYGKLGEYKGTFDLIHAAAALIQSGFRFYLVAVSHGWQEHRVRRLIDELGIAEYVRFMPFLPHWKIPGFIRSCTAIAFLERDFPITAHTPTIPTEVIACAKCLVVSEEIARKQLFRAQIRNFGNIVVVSDPKQHDRLAAALQFALQDPSRAGEMGQRGLSDFGIGLPHNKYIDHLEVLLTAVAQEQPVARPLSTAVTSEPRGPRDVIEMTGRLFPYTSALLDEDGQERVREATASTSLGAGIDDRGELANELGRVFLSALQPDDTHSPSPAFEVCRYECTVHEWAAKARPPGQEPMVEGSFSPESLADLYPSVLGDMDVVEFACDVEAICTAIDASQPIPQHTDSVKVLFHAGSIPLRVNDPTHHLLDLLADGSWRVSEVLSALSETYQCRDEPKLLGSIISIFEGLYWQGVVEFKAAPAAKTSCAGTIR